MITLDITVIHVIRESKVSLVRGFRKKEHPAKAVRANVANALWQSRGYPFFLTQ